jgi:hypothetical protein
MRASTSAALGQNILSFQSMTIQDPEMNRIYWDGLADRSALSEPDRRRFDPLLTAQFSILIQQSGFAQDGIADPRLWEQQVEGLRWSLRQPGVTQWWRDWGMNMGHEFREFVDGLIRIGEA